MLDGEIIALDENGRPSFNTLQNRRFHRDAVQFYAFDLFIYNGHSLLGLPLEKRREWLEVALNKVIYAYAQQKDAGWPRRRL